MKLQTFASKLLFYFQVHVVEALIEGYPDAVKSREDKGGRLPLHIACIHSASAQVLRLLTERYEESLRITDKVHGRLPLHFACLYGSPFEISLLVGAEQRALVFKDANGKTPKDLAVESCNPHREAIVMRLEERTRVVTEAMILRRQQQSESAQDQLKRKVTSRRSSKTAVIIPLEDIQAVQQANRRAKSLGLGNMASDVTVRKDNTARTKSTGLEEGNHTEKNRRSSLCSKTSGMAKMERVKASSGSHAIDDSNIDKESKSSKRNRVGNKASTSRQKFERRTSDPAISRHVKNGSTAMSNLQKKLQSAESSELDYDDLDRSRKSGRRMDKLSMFLRSHEADSTDDERESEHKSVGAQSLPALLHTSRASHKPLQRAENRRIARTFMFDDSDDGMEFLPSSKGTASNAESDSLEEKSQLAAMNKRLRNLDIRREALTQECEAICVTIAKKEDAALRSRKVVSDIRSQLLELQESLEREQNALSLAETGLQLQIETLAVHEIKIRTVDSEKALVLAEMARLESTGNNNTVVADT